MAQKIQKVAVCPCLSAFSCWPCASSPPRGVALFGIPQLAAPVFLEKAFLCQFLLEGPYRFLVGHLVAAGQPEEVAEREPVADLVFRHCRKARRQLAACMSVWSLSLPILIRGKYTNNSLNDNWLRKILIVKSSKTATWPKREFQVSFHIDFWPQTTGNQIEIIIYPVYKYSTRKKCIFATKVTLHGRFKIPAPPHFLSVLF